MEVTWKSRLRNYDYEILKLREKFTRFSTDDYPLKPIVVTESKLRHHDASVGGRRGSGHSSRSSGSATPTLSDPLSAVGAQVSEGADPLSLLASTPHTITYSKAGSNNSSAKRLVAGGRDGGEQNIGEEFEPWSSKKQTILAKYTTCEKLTITTSFLSSDSDKVIIKGPAHVTDKVKNRLEQLDDFEEGSVKEMLNLSQQEYVRRIDELNFTMVSEWERDQRVRALKIAIQCSKLLADTSVIQFYPSKFVLITDILDGFGRLVYNRLHEKAQHVDPVTKRMSKLPAKFTSRDVSEPAKETCRNWFYKIASIRELIPRIYLEAAIIKCYRFIMDNEQEVYEVLSRLSHMVRGIGNPLVATFTRCYICRVGMEVMPMAKQYISQLFDDFLVTYTQLLGDVVQNDLALQKVEMSTYYSLYSPAVDWMLQCVAHRAEDVIMEQVVEQCGKLCNSALLLNSIMSAFQPSSVSNKALRFIQLIKACEDSGLSKHLLYRTLGMCVVIADPREGDKLSILNEAWKTVTRLKMPKQYMECAEVWIEYVCKHFGRKEIDTLLGDIIRHMLPDRAYEEHYQQLHAVMEKVLSHVHDFYTLFSMEKFLPFIDLFQKESVKVEVCKLVMSSFARFQVENTNDPVITNATMYLCKVMHDSVNALSLDDEKRQISTLICQLISKIDFGTDFEQQLSFYVECRASFSNLEQVLMVLIQCVNRLASDTRNMVKGHHTRKTAAFVRACSAYVFITIPSVSSLLSKLNLYLISAQVSYLNQCVMQGDSCMKAAISCVPELPKTMHIDNTDKSTEPLLLEYLLSFFSTLLIVPDHPGEGVLYLLRGLLNVLQDYTWDLGSDNLVKAYLGCLHLLAAYSQPQYLYHISKVESNDSLYGSDVKFISEVNRIAETLIKQMLQHLLDISNDYKRQSELALDFFIHLLSCADLSEASLFKLAVNLWNLSQKHGFHNHKLVAATYNSVKMRVECPKEGKIYAALLDKMVIESRA